MRFGELGLSLGLTKAFDIKDYKLWDLTFVVLIVRFGPAYENIFQNIYLYVLFRFDSGLAAAIDLGSLVIDCPDKS